MRKLHVAAETKEEAQDLAPWAAVIVEVECGWLAFESVEEAATWEAQV